MPPVTSGVGVGAAVAAGVSVGSAVCMGVGYIHGEVSVGTGVGVVRLGRLVGFTVGLTVAVGFTVAVGSAVGVGVGFAVGVGSAVGVAVGFAVCVGCTVGVIVGVGIGDGSAVGSAVGCSGSAVSLISGVGVGSSVFAPPLALFSIIISAMFSAALSISSAASMPIVRLNARLVLIIVIASLPFYSASALAISAAMYCPSALSAAYSSASFSATEYTLSLTSSP